MFLIILMIVVLVLAILWWGPNTDYIYNKCSCPEDEDDDDLSGYRKRNPWATAVTWILPFFVSWFSAVYFSSQCRAYPRY